MYYLQLTAGSRRPSELVSHQADEYITCPRCLHSSPFQWLPLTPPAVLITGAPGNTPSSHRSWTKPCLCDGTGGIKKAKDYSYISHKQPAASPKTTPHKLLTRKVALCLLHHRTACTLALEMSHNQQSWYYKPIGLHQSIQLTGTGQLC